MVLSSDQFDILVKIINSSVTDNKTAMALLPVSTIMYRVRGRRRGRGREAEGEEGIGWLSVSKKPYCVGIHTYIHARTKPKRNFTAGIVNSLFSPT